MIGHGISLARSIFGRLTLLGIACCTNVAVAQAGSGNAKLTLQGAAEANSSIAIRDALNRPCLDIEAAAKPHVVNPDVVDHVVSIKNNCPKLIKVKVCYFNSDRCNQLDLQGYKRVDTILGTMTKVTMFRYSVFQKLPGSLPSSSSLK